MDLRSNSPFWLAKSTAVREYPKLRKDEKAEVVVIGAGITGALVACHLIRSGFEVVIVDKRRAGTGSTAASTGLLQYEIDTPLRKLIRKAGILHAVQSYLLCIRAIDDIEKICNCVGPATSFTRKESFQYASYTKDVAGLLEEYKLRRKYDIDVEFLSSSDIRNKFGFSAPAGLLSRQGGQVDAYSLTQHLLRSGGEIGLRTYENTEVTQIQYKNGKPLLTTRDRHKIKADHLVIACGYESNKYVPKKVEKLNSTYAIISEPHAAKNLWHKNCLIWETANPYLYIRTAENNRILVGGKDDAFYDPDSREKKLPKKAKLLEKSFARLFPQIGFTTEYKWSGTFASTKDGLPFIGSIKQRPATSFALGFGGNGITFSVIAAQMIRNKLLGKSNKFSPIFAFDR